LKLGNNVLLDDKDEILLETLRQDVCVGRKNVLVISEEEFYLDAIFLRLYNELKDTDGLAVHRMFQPDVEGIVGWFNKLLAEVSIDEARNLDDQPKTIIFMPEITNSNIQDWISCESLIGAFPGANVSLIAFGRSDKINPPTVANIAAKRQNSVVRLPQLSPERVEPFFREAKHSGELSVLMSALIDSPWRELALTVQEEVETEVEAGNDIIDQLNPSSLEESGVDEPKKSESDVNLNSDNEVDPAQNDHSWLRRFVVTTALFFIAFLSIIFTWDFLYNSSEGALIIQSVVPWLEWFLSMLEQFISWGGSFVDRILSAL
tara:strand:- start:217 stop:1173 length:957 start_codon:yes stop_codon:yes gene_type:complete